MEIEPTPLPSTRLIAQSDSKSNRAKKGRVAAHSHVKGLGLSPETGEAERKAGGFVGQQAAREACGMVVELVRQKKMAGRAMLLAGPPGTGKTAMAIAMSQELGDQVPFCLTVGSEVFSSEVKKTEMLMESVRRAIGVRVRERKEIYEGEVTQIEPVEVEPKSNVAVAHAGKAISRVLLSLKTDKGTRTLRLDPSIYEDLVKQRVAVGDVVYIEATSGAVKRVGRCDLYATENDIETDEWVPMPKGEVHKTRELVQHATLYDFDKAGASQRDSKMLSLLNEVMGHRKTEITARLRHEVDKAVNQYIQEGQAELIPGVLFIDEVHMLDLECFTFLHRVLESEVSPIIVFATNRGRVKTRDGDEEQLHGIPADLLDRLMIVLTAPHNSDDIMEILKIRSQAEEVQLSDEAHAHLREVAEETRSIRYAIQLMTPAKLLAQASGREEIAKSDVEQCQELFMDARTSAAESRREVATATKKDSTVDNGGVGEEHEAMET